MKEIEELKSLSADHVLFRREYEFNDLKVKRDLGEEYFVNLLQELNWTDEDTEILKFWKCRNYFYEGILLLIDNIKSKVDHNMSQPFSTIQKNENLKTVISECIALYFNFTSLGSHFGRSAKLNFESLENPIFTKLPIFKVTSIYSGTALIKDSYNYALKLFNTDFSDFICEIRKLSKGNILALTCDSVSVEILCLIDFLMKAFPKYISEKEVERIIKKMDQGINVNEVVKRGRPIKVEEDLTIQDIWKSEKYNFEDIVALLIHPKGILDEGSFVIKEDDKYIWQKVPFGFHVKYIQGFLFFCHDKGFIDLKQYSRRDIQKMFEKTFQLKVNEKDMFSENILKVEKKYHHVFWL